MGGESENSDDHAAEEQLRKKILMQERAKALNPIRTRFLPEWEKEEEKKSVLQQKLTLARIPTTNGFMSPSGE